MRILAVTHTFPWPPFGGGAIRMAQTLRSLGRCGSLDVVSILQAETARQRTGLAVPGVDRLLVVPRPIDQSVSMRRLARLATGHLPASRRADYGAVRASFTEWIAGEHYDLVWLGCGTEGFVALGDVLPAGVPVVANLDDLEDDKIASRLAAESGDIGAWETLRARIDVRRWRRLHKEVGAQVSRVVVCSDHDADRLRDVGVRRPVVIPNVYDVPDEPLGRIRVGSPPVITFVGALDYRPNMDAARVMAEQVLPVVRRQLPDAQLRLVGRSHRGISGVSTQPGVVATGLVEDLDEELARADIVVAPIRFGSGTRIKILEAFAHRIPVVSTTLGAAGLGVASGRELMIADDPSEFATACVDLLHDESLRTRLVDAAHLVWEERFRAEVLEQGVSRLVDELVPTVATSVDDTEG